MLQAMLGNITFRAARSLWTRTKRITSVNDGSKFVEISHSRDQHTGLQGSNSVSMKIAAIATKNKAHLFGNLLHSFRSQTVGTNIWLRGNALVSPCLSKIVSSRTSASLTTRGPSDTNKFTKAVSTFSSAGMDTRTLVLKNGS